MDINDPFIQKALRGDCARYKFSEVVDFAERNPDEIRIVNPNSKKKNKICILVNGVDRSPRIPFIKFEQQHGKGDKYIDSKYINDLIGDLTVAGHIPREDDNE